MDSGLSHGVHAVPGLPPRATTISRPSRSTRRTRRGERSRPTQPVYGVETLQRDEWRRAMILPAVEDTLRRSREGRETGYAEGAHFHAARYFRSRARTSLPANDRRQRTAPAPGRATAINAAPTAAATAHRGRRLRCLLTMTGRCCRHSISSVPRARRLNTVKISRDGAQSPGRASAAPLRRCWRASAYTNRVHPGAMRAF